MTEDSELAVEGSMLPEAGERPMERFVAALEGAGCGPEPRSPGRWRARCPAHDDARPSLDFEEGEDGRVLLTCRSAGCSFGRVVSAVGLERADLFPGRRGRRSIEQRERAERLAQATVRMAGDMGARWRLCMEMGWTPSALVAMEVGLSPDGRVVLPERAGTGSLRCLTSYRQPSKRSAWFQKLEAEHGAHRGAVFCPEAVRASSEVFVVEGGPDAVTAASLGLTAVGAPSAGVWTPHWSSRLLRGKVVTVVADCDPAGRAHALRVAGDAARVAAGVRVVDLDPGRADGHDLGDLVREVGRETAMARLVGLRDAADPLPRRAPGRPLAAREAAAEHVRSSLARGPRPWAEVLAASPASKATTERAKADLGVVSITEGGRRLASMPDEAEGGRPHLLST